MTLAHPIAPNPSPALDLRALKAKQRMTWSSGDYSVIGTTLQIVGEQLCESLDLRPGQRVLDVAAGNGNASLAAARRHGEVVSTDYVPALLEAGRRRASAEGLPIAFQDADAEALPFADSSFDVVTSVFGVMFTPDQEQAAAELARVCRPGGSIGLANWTPDGFIGQMFGVVGRFLPPPPGVAPPSRWGTDTFVRERFGAAAATIATNRRHFVFRYRSAAHWLDVFATWYGPVLKAFAALDRAGQAELTADLEDLVRRFNRSGDQAMIVPAEYLETVLVQKG